MNGQHAPTTNIFAATVAMFRTLELSVLVYRHGPEGRSGMGETIQLPAPELCSHVISTRTILWCGACLDKTIAAAVLTEREACARVAEREQFDAVKWKRTPDGLAIANRVRERGGG